MRTPQGRQPTAGPYDRQLPAHCGHIGRTGPNVQMLSAPITQSDPASTTALPERCDRIAQGRISSGFTNTSLAVIAA